MSITNRASLTAHFETGDIPTQDNFVDLIESSANLTDNNTFQVAPKVTTNEGAVGTYPNSLLINGIGLEKMYDSGAATDASEGTGDALVLRGASSLLAPVTGDGASVNVFANLPNDAVRLDKSKSILFKGNQHIFNGLGELNTASLLEIKSGSTAYTEESNLSAAEISLLDHVKISRPALSAVNLKVNDVEVATLSANASESKTIFGVTNASGDNMLVINDTDRKVGINKSSPAATLHIVNTEAANDGSGNKEALRVVGNVLLTTKGATSLVIQADSDDIGENDNPLIRLKQDSTGSINTDIGINGTLNVQYDHALEDATYIHSNHGSSELNHKENIQFAVNNTAAMTIRGTPGGNSADVKIGIGRNSDDPSTTLHVKGTTTLSALSGITLEVGGPANTTTLSASEGLSANGVIKIDGYEPTQAQGTVTNDELLHIPININGKTYGLVLSALAITG